MKKKQLTISLSVTKPSSLCDVAQADQTLVVSLRASSYQTVKPNICLAPVTTLEESPPGQRQREGPFSLCVGELFSCGLIYAGSDWPGELL